MNKKLLVLFFVLSLIWASGVVYAQTNIVGVINQTEIEAETNYEGIKLGERTLQIGMYGEDVAAMQLILNKLGFREGNIDGTFGPLTHVSVLRFQEDEELTANGIVKDETMDMLLDLQIPAENKVTAELAQAVNEFNFTEADLNLFARIVHAESQGEPYLGQVAVAATILNRIRSEQFPNTMGGVVYQIESGRYQYSPVLNGRINLPAGESAKKAVQEALSGVDPTYGSTGFYNPAKTANAWVRSRPATLSIGSHVFFK